MHKFTFALLVIFLLGGCVKYSRPPIVAEPMVLPISTSSASETVSLPSVQQVNIFGNIHLLINGHRLENALVINGDLEQIKNLKIINDNGVLTLIYHSGFLARQNLPINIELNLSHDLAQINDRGTGTLVTKNIGDQALNLNLMGQVQARMTGNNIVLQRVMLANQATLYAYWINSTQLSLWLHDQSKVFLGGVVDQIYVKADHTADLEGRYLHVQSGFIKTTDRANVSVNVKQALSTLSTNNSTVYYYHDSDFGDHYLGQSGSALRMVGIPFGH